MPTPKSSPRQRLCFNDGWRFHRGDAPDARGALTRERLEPWRLPTSAELLHAAAPPPPRPAAEPAPRLSFIQPGFDDTSWRQLDLPHDWAIEGPFSADLPGETGKLPWQGVAWYRKVFQLARRDARGLVELHLDGAMSYATIWLNGRCVGGWAYGYTSFKVDLTPHARFGESNVLAIRLDNPPQSSRWYPGAGLYRNTWLVKTPRLRFSHNGAFVTAPGVGAASAWVNVALELENGTAKQALLTLETAIFEVTARGALQPEPVAVSNLTELRLDAGHHAHRSHGVEVKSPKLWSVETPRLYAAVSKLRSKGRLIDSIQTRFGIRSLRFDANDGFFLNERPLRLNGVCMHHDLGALGAAVSESAIRRQVTILKDMGCNAIRTAHNPPAPELPAICDEVGMLLMVEAFDCWRRGKKWPEGMQERDPRVSYFDYARAFDSWHEQDLRAMVRRDRNHPSVVMWSIGNEVIEQWWPDGWKLAQRLAGIVREEDRTRPITSGFNAEIAGYSGFETAVDVVGFNYKPAGYAPFHAAYPTTPVLGAETASTLSSRGEYFFPLSDDPAEGRADFQVSSYDLSTPRWAFTPDREFRGLDEAPFALGEFVWTGFDYLGEPTPYNSDSTSLLNFSDPGERERAAKDLARLGKIQVPSRSSYFGIVDLAGFPKDRYYLYQARWRPTLRMAHILPHWNWPERIGQITPVHVYSSGDEAELFLNGKSQGRRRRAAYEYRFRWDEVTYAPGLLEVVTYRKGKKWATATRQTTGQATRLGLVSDRDSLHAEGRELVFITVSVLDARGQCVPRSHAEIELSTSGPGDIVAVDNGDPTSLEPFQAIRRKAFNGLLLVVLEARPRRKGRLVLTARSHGLAKASIEVAVQRLAAQN